MHHKKGEVKDLNMDVNMEDELAEKQALIMKLDQVP